MALKVAHAARRNFAPKLLLAALPEATRLAKAWEPLMPQLGDLKEGHGPIKGVQAVVRQLLAPGTNTSSDLLAYFIRIKNRSHIIHL